MRSLALLFVVACGDSSEPPDAALPDAHDRGALVSVHITGSDVVGKDVVFQATDSTVVLATRTDAAGRASAFMEPGGFVSLLDTNALTGELALYTWGDVAPGDVFSIRHPDRGALVSTHQLHLAERAGSSYYELYASCVVFPTDVSAAVQEARRPPFWVCGERQNVLVVAYGLAGDAYQFVPDVAISAGSTDTLELPDQWRPVGSDIHFTSASARSVTVHQQLERGNFTRTTSVDVVGTATVTLPMPAPSTGIVQTLVEHTGAPATDVVAQWTAGAPSVTVDLDALALRATRDLHFDPARSRIVWNEPTAGHAGDVMHAELSFTNARGELVPWKLLAPRDPSTPSMRVPVLPRSRMRPLPDSLAVTSLTLIALDGGYSRVKASLLGTWSPGFAAFWPIVDAPTGSVHYRTLR